MMVPNEVGIVELYDLSRHAHQLAVFASESIFQHTLSWVSSDSSFASLRKLCGSLTSGANTTFSANDPSVDDVARSIVAALELTCCWMVEISMFSDLPDDTPATASSGGSSRISAARSAIPAGAQQPVAFHWRSTKAQSCQIARLLRHTQPF